MSSKVRAVALLVGAVAAENGERYEGQWNIVGKAMVHAVVEGTGAVTANVIVRGSNNGVNWHDIGTIALSDTDVDSGVQGIDYPWAFVTADLDDDPTGTGAAVTATLSI